MKKNLPPLLARASLVGVTLGFGTIAFGQQPGSSPTTAAASWPGVLNPQAQMSLETATPQSEAFGVTKLSGNPLRGSHQEQLSTINDFLVDPQTGQVHFAVAHSGAGPGGETYRLVPIDALDATGGPEALTARIDSNAWQKVGTLTEQRLQGAISINQDHQQRLRQEFGLSEAATEAASPLNLIRATSLNGRSIQSGAEQLGQVEDVVIDFHNRRAAPLVKTSGGVAGAEQRVLVPFHRLQMSSDQSQGVITANVTRAELQQLTPTGYASGQNPQDANAAAASVRQGIQNVSSGTQGSVQVIPESRLVLRGAVDSEQKKSEIEQAARQAAPGVRIDNQITVQSW